MRMKYQKELSIIMKNRTYIYGLKDPITKKIRYIGKANNPIDRLYKHMADKRINHRTCWLKSLKKNNLIPIIEIIAIVKRSEWTKWEIFFIDYYTKNGFNLVNGTKGGDGVVATDIVREKISKAMSKKQVLKYTLEGNLVAVYRNCVKAGLAANVSRAIIGKVCNGKGKSGGGFMWRFHNIGEEIEKNIKPYKRERYSLKEWVKKNGVWNKKKKKGLI